MVSCAWCIVCIRVVTVRKFSNRSIEVLSMGIEVLYNGIIVVGGRLSFPSFSHFSLVLNSL